VSLDVLRTCDTSASAQADSKYKSVGKVTTCVTVSKKFSP
jgi:hypothetical protein